MTKTQINSAFVEFMRTNKLTYDVDQSVLRTDSRTQAYKRTSLTDSVNTIETLKAYLAQEDTAE